MKKVSKMLDFAMFSLLTLMMKIKIFVVVNEEFFMKNQHNNGHACHHNGKGAGCDMHCSQCKKECEKSNTHAKKEFHAQHHEERGHEKKEHPKKWNS